VCDLIKQNAVQEALELYLKMLRYDESSATMNQGSFLRLAYIHGDERLQSFFENELKKHGKEWMIPLIQSETERTTIMAQFW
jgi:hypothetical protein